MSDLYGKEQKKKNNIRKMTGWILSVIQAAVSVVFFLILNRANLLTAKWIVIVLAVLAALWMITRFMIGKGKAKIRFVIGVVLTVLICAGTGIGSYYLNSFTNTLKNITDAETETTLVGIYVLKDDPALSVADTKTYKYGIAESLDREGSDNVIAQVNQELATEVSVDTYAGIEELADALLNGKIQVIVLNEAFVDILSEAEGYAGFADRVKEIGVYGWKNVVSNDVKAEIVEEGNEKTQEPVTLDEGVFEIYISGIDTWGDVSTRRNSDVNIIAVINANTRQILLLSTPRDYYLPLSMNGEMDKLTHAGIYGVDVSMDTLDMLYGTSLDYYFKVNFSGFEELIDALGGVTVHSDYTFDVGDFHYVEGENYLSGIEALAFARERHSFAAGDRQRGKNQMEVIKGVMNKMMSPSILGNFSQLMSSLEGCFDSSIPYDLLSDLVKMQLADNTSWNIVSYSVDGGDGKESCYSLSSPNYVMKPYQETVDKAIELIRGVKEGEVISIE